MEDVEHTSRRGLEEVSRDEESGYDEKDVNSHIPARDSGRPEVKDNDQRDR
jgi:hypothetical protein